ncbi:MAG: HAD family phosphatase [Candidatus Micrarchaeaceae archaeon]
MQKLIIFDLGGVIIDYKGEQYYNYLYKKTGIKYDRIVETLLPLIDKLERKKFSVREFEKEAIEKLGISAKRIDWIREFKDDSKINECVEKIVYALSKKYTVVALSNIDVGRYRATIHKYGTMGFKKIFASCFIGTRKPDPAIYKYVLAKTGFAAKDAIFIDNQEENVNGARKVGIKAIKFTDCISLKNALSKNLEKNK